MQKEIQLVQESFKLVEPIAETASELFYDRLFTIAPELRPMFSDDLSDQRVKLMKSLTFIVYGLDDLAGLMPAISGLAERHNGYGVEDAHYDKVGAALLWTLEQGLGPKFTPEVKAAWVVIYSVLAQTMQDAARNSRAAAA